MSEVKVNKISPRTNCGTVTVGDSGDSVSVAAGVPVTVNGDLKSNALKATDGGSIISQSGTTITLGASGDTVSLASGASQTGFGRSGAVNWDTTAKTAGFTGVSGNGYFINTTSGAITVNLPASPSAGDIMAVKDYTGTAGTNAITVGRNSSNIRGAASNYTLAKANAGATFIFIDGTEGWQAFNDGSDADVTNTFISASGGTETNSPCGNYKIHTFTGPGTFTVNSLTCSAARDKVDYIVVAGGAGGGSSCAAGGGGAGGFRESHCSSISGTYTASPLATTSSLPVGVQGYSVTIGAGGAGGSCSTTSNPGNNGSNSGFSTITSAGGGKGGANPSNASSGGSGGGGAHNSGTGGTGNTPPVSPAQGNNGENASTPSGTTTDDGGGGGGGAIEAGGTDLAAEGGDGAPTEINGSATFFAGGGGGGTRNIPGSQSPVNRAGGAGGGGQGGGSPSYPRPTAAAAGTAGTANTGGGGGGATRSSPNSPSPSPVGAGGTGGSGIVIIRYKFQ